MVVKSRVSLELATGLFSLLDYGLRLQSGLVRSYSCSKNEVAYCLRIQVICNYVMK